ncbi:DUF1835 domain-containing protein [Azospirillum sp. SYSU D00513]|uniref:DUF1835 domain-containing protein n=1 Tax=Azospirillum sp. SYSU D00513 TaxID=2812561 RepID=UPI001FFFB345|nr:DUF1835 domain-containing protein [Azospirillum sp. SYSU D00513]
MTDRSGRPEAPFRLDLEQQRKRAKELLRDLRAGEPAALARWQAHPQRDPAQARLSDAQFVIARELGSPSWPRLRAHVEAMGRERAAIGGSAPDGGMRTLHVRCGSDIRASLIEAGFTGDFLEHSDPYCQGPVPDGPDLDAVRARFIAGAYGGVMGLSEEAAADRLRREEEALARAAAEYERVVVWCEHDSYDQLTLARCLALFAETGAPAVLELVSIDRFPGAARFIGLGQLPPEALRVLWPERRPLGKAELAIGVRAWNALRRADPTGLAALAASECAGLPDLPGALRRHLRELPWTGDGLSLTERLTLDLIEAAPLTVGQLFARLTREREPLPWLGDVMFLAVVEGMARAREPAFTMPDAGPEVRWPDRRLEITAAGRALLRGELDWLSMGPPERWVGGVRIGPGAPDWRWDEAGERPVRR